MQCHFGVSCQHKSKLTNCQYFIIESIFRSEASSVVSHGERDTKVKSTQQAL